MPKVYWDDGQGKDYREIETQFEDCPSCGSQLVYSAKSKMIQCEHCGYSEETRSEKNNIVELELKKALDRLQHFEPGHMEKYGFQCGNCGARFLIERDDVRIQCGFCASEQVNKTAIEENFVQPLGIIPFYISRPDAEVSYKKWIEKGWFHPNSLKKESKLHALHGIYIPFWTFDAHTEAHWSGQAGHYYYVTRRVYVNGKMQTRRVRKTRWVSRSGTLRHFFDDITVSGSDKIDRKLVDRILPYRLDEAVNFDPRLLLGWESEIYDIEINIAYDMADQIMDFKLRHMCSGQLGGDTQRSLNVRSQKSQQTFKLLVLPLWISSYKYRGKLYHFLINGQTGRVYGKKPLSWWKIALLILLILIFVAGLVILRESGIIQI